MSYCELPEWYEDKEVAARKEHKCVECKAPILVGEKHLVYKGSWSAVDGFDTGRQHLLCRDACVFIRDKFNGGECIGFGDLSEFWDDYGPDPKHEDGKKFRSMMAKIIWRERKYGTSFWRGPK